MKYLIILFSVFLFSCGTKANQPSEIEKSIFSVRGNCGMCKTTIENTANSLEGVDKAEWNANTEQLVVSYNSKKVETSVIEKAIAATGYDTEHYSGDIEKYQNLPACCVYTDKKE